VVKANLPFRKEEIMENKSVAVLGITGSVGMQVLDVIEARGERLDFFSVNKNIEAAEAIARRFLPRLVAVADETCAKTLKSRLADTDVRVLAGSDGIIEGIGITNAKTVVNSIIGAAGLMPTLATLDRGLRLALANKESLVVAGDIVMKRARERKAEILPVDSEHSAIFQSLKSGECSEIKKIILTASGGPFFGKSLAELSRVTVKETLAHPTWKMGKKITVDCATLMNKGFEIIEAIKLFGVPAQKIEVVIHRQSILHSAVEYIDNTVIGAFSVPDMRSCIEYALDYPSRRPSVTHPLDLTKIGALTFEAPDAEAFPLLELAKRAITDGGAAPAVLNAADEVAVDAFLRSELSFVGIYDVILKTYERLHPTSRCVDSIEGILAIDRAARRYAREFI
jgi:1-deoxy-D-xylulose-5-phosphate reductoisomerase